MPDQDDSIPPAVELEENDPPAAIPPIIDPARFEDFPVFRECFLSCYVTDRDANGILRSFGGLLYDLVLEYWHEWPDQPEGQIRADLRAVVADMRYLQGRLSGFADPEVEPSSHEEFLGRLAVEIAVEIGKLADRIERELGTWRGAE